MEDLKEHVVLILTILGSVLTICGILVTVIYNLFIKRMDKVEKNVEDLEKRMNALETETLKELIEVRTNYTKRFDGVNSTMNNNHIEIKDLINDLMVKIEKQSQFCYLIQKQKEKEL